MQVHLRPVADADFAPLTRMLEAPEVAYWWGRYDEAKLRAEVATGNAEGWAIEADGELVGFLMCSEEKDPDWGYVEPDLFVAAEHHGRGIGREALRIVLRKMFEEHGHHRALIEPAKDNEAAIRSYSAIGFRPVGTLRKADRAPDGTWRDTLLMDLLAEELR